MSCNSYPTKSKHLKKAVAISLEQSETDLKELKRFFSAVSKTTQSSFPGTQISRKELKHQLWKIIKT